jgi:hypothetical protein
MTIRFLLTTALLVSVFCSNCVSVANDHKLTSVKEAPKGLSPEIEKLLDPVGHQITGTDGAVVELWLLKNLPVKSGFKPNFTQFYPFTPGQLLGALRIPKDVEYMDFRGQQISSGTYTLRYGLQPMDGNHVGTSETYDFILALPAKIDTKSATIEDFHKLSEHSGKAAGSTHPAIFSLLDPAEASKGARLEQDSFTDHWILNFTGKGIANDEKSEVKVRLVVVGQFAG